MRPEYTPSLAEIERMKRLIREENSERDSHKQEKNTGPGIRVCRLVLGGSRANEKFGDQLC